VGRYIAQQSNTRGSKWGTWITPLLQSLFNRGFSNTRIADEIQKHRLAKKQPASRITAWINQQSVPMAPLAFAVGETLGNFGLESNGPIALYMAGQYFRLVKLLAQLSSCDDQDILPCLLYTIRILQNPQDAQALNTAMDFIAEYQSAKLVSQIHLTQNQPNPDIILISPKKINEMKKKAFNLHARMRDYRTLLNPVVLDAFDQSADDKDPIKTGSPDIDIASIYYSPDVKMFGDEFALAKYLERTRDLFSGPTECFNVFETILT
jgi:hypothetical protein